jgi:hypothetical protein
VARLQTWLEAIQREVEPLEQGEATELDSDTRERLEALGYTE